VVKIAMKRETPQSRRKGSLWEATPVAEKPGGTNGVEMQ
jgi:hypothetical protein